MKVYSLGYNLKTKCSRDYLFFISILQYFKRVNIFRQMAILMWPSIRHLTTTNVQHIHELETKDSLSYSLEALLYNYSIAYHS